MLSRPTALLGFLILAFPFRLAAETSRPPATLPPGPEVSVPGVAAGRATIPFATSIPIPQVNQVILNQIAGMPRQGGYAVSHAASVKLANAVRLDPTGRLAVDPSTASPSYCSGATYLVFLKTIVALQDSGQLSAVDRRSSEALLIHGQRDGEGVWGRWNANGPGTARLFNELQLGRNFTRIEEALPGDFMKVFWTPAVGKKEHGHSVIFQGCETGPDGAKWVRFWSSNQGLGYGVKSVPQAKISHAIFSRLERPENLREAAKLSPTDTYLAGLLSKESDAREAREKCGMP